MHRNRAPWSARAASAYTAGLRMAGPRAVAGEGEILLYGPIGGYWEDSVYAPDVVAALSRIGDQPAHIRINSPGGDVFEGMAIRNALTSHKPGITVTVDGIAASAASFIAMAAPVVRMHGLSMFMIHRASVMAWGHDEDLMSAVDLLRKVDSMMVADYAAKTGMPEEEIRAAMNAETYYTAQEAHAAGFCNELIPDPPRNPETAPGPDNTQARLRAAARLRIAEAVV